MVFDPLTKAWHTQNLVIAAKFAEFADESAGPKITPQALRAAEQIEELNKEHSRATKSDIEIPCPPGLAYLPYQKAGIAYVVGKLGEE